MFLYPKTIEEARLWRYGKRAFIQGRCAMPVREVDKRSVFYQCHRKDGKGLNGLFCGQHRNMIHGKVIGI